MWKQNGERIQFDIFLTFIGIPAAEKFSFCLNTLLSDVAVNCPENCDEIILNQVETLNALTNMIKTSRENNSLPPIILCKATVPILLGLARSMGRYAQCNPPLLCRLHPRPEMPIVKPYNDTSGNTTQSTSQSNIPTTKQGSLSQFRSIIPRSLSGGLSVDGDLRSPCKQSNEQRASLNTFFSVPYDATTYFFSKYGSSFNQFPNMRFNEMSEKKISIQFPIQHLQTIFAIAKKLLTKETLEHLDEQAADIYSLHQIKAYGYKSFSETINLVLVTLLREILQNQKGICLEFLFLRIASTLYKVIPLYCRFTNTIHKRCTRICETIIFKWTNRIAK